MEGTQLRAVHRYNGPPAPASVCAGSWSFTLAHGPLEVHGASAGQGADYTQGTFDQGEPASVTMTRRLAVGELLTIYAGVQVGTLRLSRRRTIAVPDCSPPQPSAPPAPPAPTDAEALAGLKAGLRAARTDLERRTRDRDGPQARHGRDRGSCPSDRAVNAWR